MGFVGFVGFLGQEGFPLEFYSPTGDVASKKTSLEVYNFVGFDICGLSASVGFDMQSYSGLETTKSG